jgi:hypothetical protein
MHLHAEWKAGLERLAELKAADADDPTSVEYEEYRALRARLAQLLRQQSQLQERTE